jgi:hypothetical protein
MTTTASVDDELLDGETVKTRLGLCDRAFRELHKRGLPHFRLNQRVFRYRWNEIEQWLSQRRKGE